MAHTPKLTIPVLRPQLPDANALMPYLQRIDETRIYSNQGPLSMELEQRMSDELGIDHGGFIAASSGTAALAAAVLATAGRATQGRPFAAIPAFTFVATAVAVEQCGYLPYLIDVDEQAWALNPQALLENTMLERFGIVVPVAPYGRPQPQEPWRVFRDQTSIPVVFDGAASFDRLAGSAFLGDLPVSLSFNATKSFATGEGGAVITTDPQLAIRVRRALNFGFFLTRESRSPSINGKMSEYHAAVGLAELDGWPRKLSALEGVADRYRMYAALAGIPERIIATPAISSAYVLLAARGHAQAAAVQSALREEAIGSRLWYGRGLHRERYFAEVARERLEATERLAPTLLGIPVAPDLGETAVARIVRAIARAVEQVASC